MSKVLKDRDLRQRDIVPPERLAQVRATVVGVGAIGRQVALQLSAVGVPWMQLIDPETVEAVNIAPQGFFEEDLGRHKVDVTLDLCLQINRRGVVQTVMERFRRSMEIGNAFFCCVDSIDTRRLIWQAVRNKVDFFCDGRMSAEVVRVLAVSDAEGRNHYPTTLFAGSEAQGGSCTAKSTIFTANIAAGLMLEQFSRWLRQMPVEKDLTINLLASELTVGGQGGVPV
jgi:molybdopterin-synthase adenylyltransferase